MGSKRKASKKKAKKAAKKARKARKLARKAARSAPRKARGRKKPASRVNRGKSSKQARKQPVKKKPVAKQAAESKSIHPQTAAHAPQPDNPTVSTVVLPVRKPGEEPPKPGAGGREFDDEDELEQFDPLFDEVREERD